MSGKKIGRLFVLHKCGSQKSTGSIKWECLCDCGNIKAIDGVSLRRGSIVSCGCFNAEQASKLMTTHGYSRATGAKKATYKIWTSMLQRCNNPKSQKFHRYGARGISVCCDWHQFENFIFDMGERPEGFSIDRIDNDGNYCKDNCRWASDSDQSHNRENNRMLTHNGETMCVSEWARHIGIPVQSLWNRLRCGWDDARALTTPLAIRRKSA